MVLSRVLTRHDYATYRQTFLAYALISPVIILGLPQAIFFFLPVAKHRIRGRVFDAMAFLLVMAVLFPVFLLLGGNRLLAWQFNNPALEDTL